MENPSYVIGAELGDLGISWYDTNGALIDFSSGYTFTVKVGVRGEAALFTKTTGISGAATAPNVTVAWATSGELNSLASGSYALQVAARQTSSGKDRIQQGRINILKAVT